MTIADNPRAVIGGNQPPPTPFERAQKAVNDAYDEAMLWLDGKAIDSQEMADGVGNLITVIRDAASLADEMRVMEKTPFDLGAAEVQKRYAPLIGDTKSVKGKAVLALQACKDALKPWLEADARRIDEEARAARAEADRRRQEAEAALRATEAANLAERAAAEEQLAEAKKAEAIASRAEKQTAKAGGTFGRSAALRTVHVVEIVDAVAAVRHIWMTDPEAMTAFAREWAQERVRLGARDLPGFAINEEKRVA